MVIKYNYNNSQRKNSTKFFMAEKNIDDTTVGAQSTGNRSKKETSIRDYWNGMARKPTCIVFDLDYTLWPFNVDSSLIPPFTRRHNGIFDHAKREIQLYEDVSLIIRTLKDIFLSEPYHTPRYLAIASRSSNPDLAHQLLDMFGLIQHFDCIQIYTGTKLKHLKNIKGRLGIVRFEDILFFDDNKMNLSQAKSLGVIGHQVRRHYGLSLAELINGMKEYNQNRNELRK